MLKEALKPTIKQTLAWSMSFLGDARREKVKEYFELRFWRQLHSQIQNLDEAQRESQLVHERSHYGYFFTEFFGLTEADYRDKRVLDIGCGPMGSLEWATLASERVGLDPLAERYLELGARRHKMRYVAAKSEAIPFPDAHFDFVTTFNSLDHVENVAQTAREMARVTAPGGTILIMTEIDHIPTFTEPHRLSRAVLDLFSPHCDVAYERTFGVPSDHNLYAGMKAGLHHEPGKPGVLAARLTKRRT